MHGMHFIQDLAVILVVGGVMGWLCQRVGLSVVVGYLVAGILVGPKSPPMSLLTDADTIETLAQLGLVFLMFSIGLRLSVRKIRRLGFSLLASTAAGALVMYYLSRLLGAALGWSNIETLFLAAILMISSSAIITKILQETGTTHERSGQLAMGISVMEDVVGVGMLTILNSIVHMGRGTEAHVGSTLLMLAAFVVVAGIGGMLLVPWLLRRMSISADEELQTIGIAALLFGLAVVATRAGYSLALGSFLLGTIVAETPNRHQVERTFEGMRDVFSAVFFVAIGMQIDARDLWANAGLILAVGVFALVARPFAVTCGLALIGTPLREAFRTGLTATPIGEFSFIIAQLGVTALVMPPKFYPLAVGVSLVTTIAAPVLTRRSEYIASAAGARQARWMFAWVRAYHGWLAQLQRRRARNLMWQLSRKRIGQLVIGCFLVTGLIIFSRQMFALVERWLGRDRLFPHDLDLFFWLALVAITLAPLVAIWRNISAMAMLYAEVSTKGHPHAKRLRVLVENGLKILSGGAMFVWLASIVPADGTAKWILLMSGVVVVVALLALRRKLIYWHSEMEVELISMMDLGDTRMSATTAPWLQPHGDWNLHMVDCTLPDLADCQGQKISDLALRSRFGCSIVGIERQGFMIPLPTPDAVLYPRDKVLLLGTAAQVEAGRSFLGAVSGAPVADSLFAEVQMEVLRLPEWSRAVARTLGQLAPARDHGVQVAGIHRGPERILNPTGSETLCGGDELLVLGTPVQLAEFKTWLREKPEESNVA